jgi:hypothetical protein
MVDVILLSTALLVSLLAFATSVLTLSAVGHLHTKDSARQAQVADCKSAVQFQSRATRRALVTELRKVEGYRETPKSDLEVAMEEDARGETPTIFKTFGQLGGRRE